MKIAEIIQCLEAIAPSALQEDYDNSGLLLGNPQDEVSKALLCLDSTEAVVDEAIAQGCELIIAHHPLIFKGIKRLNGNNYVEKTLLKAIRHGIAIYACHTNLDNVHHMGVNSMIAERLGLRNTKVLRPMQQSLMKLVAFVPHAHTEAVLTAAFGAGAGGIGNYDECSFILEGRGTFRPGLGTNPFIGEHGVRHIENEARVEWILPRYNLSAVMHAIRQAHPYEEIAYDLYAMEQANQDLGSGLVGELETALSTEGFLTLLKDRMELKQLRFTQNGGAAIKKVAVCGGSGSFLIKDARAVADAYVTADVKYHEFFDAEDRLLLCDIGHYESEKYTIELFRRILSEKFPNFATIFARTDTNPVNYY